MYPKGVKRDVSFTENAIRDSEFEVLFPLFCQTQSTTKESFRDRREEHK